MTTRCPGGSESREGARRQVIPYIQKVTAKKHTVTGQVLQSGVKFVSAALEQPHAPQLRTEASVLCSPPCLTPALLLAEAEGRWGKGGE